MKREEKNQQSRERILTAAIAEFGAKGYEGASLNTVLSEHGISKGLVYHYFENKDQLYLACVKRCLDGLTEALSAVNRDARAVLQSYFEVRSRFFLSHPSLWRVFFDALLQPPEHLRGALAALRTELDGATRVLFQAALRGMPLRSGISVENALSYFSLMQNALHLRLLSLPYSGEADALALCEEQTRDTLELLLYGLVRKDEEK